MGRPLVALMDDYPEMPSRIVRVRTSGRIEEAEPTLSVRIEAESPRLSRLESGPLVAEAGRPRQ
jgi:hypothetical protein